MVCVQILEAYYERALNLRVSNASVTTKQIAIYNNRRTLFLLSLEA